MPTFGAIAYTPSVRAAQQRLASPVSHSVEDPDEAFALGGAEREFLVARDGFYQASVSSAGWPYVQYRGGPPGFVQVLGPTTLGYADLRGNRQYISVGNLADDDRVALFFMDYASRQRLKLLGHARSIEDRTDAAFVALATHADKGRVERAVIIEVVAGDWNCRQHITPRWSADEVAAALAPLHQRIGELEAELARRP